MASSQQRKPLAKREREIGLRLRQVRDSLRYSQREFAQEVGITRARLASYEEGRAPLRYDLALRICRHFIIGEKWLATGQAAQFQYLDLISERVPHNWPIDSPFSATYDTILSPIYESLAKTHGFRIDIRDTEPVQFLHHLFNFYVGYWSKQLKDGEHRRELLQRLLQTGFAFTKFVHDHDRAPSSSEVIDYPSEFRLSAGKPKPGTKSS